MHSRRRRKSKKASFRDEPRNVAATLLWEKKTLIGMGALVGLALGLTLLARVFITPKGPKTHEPPLVVHVGEELHREAISTPNLASEEDLVEPVGPPLELAPADIPKSSGVEEDIVVDLSEDAPVTDDDLDVLPALDSPPADEPMRFSGPLGGRRGEGNSGPARTNQPGCELPVRQHGGAVPAEPEQPSRYRYGNANFCSVTEKPFSTFSIDVDTASYSYVRRYLTNEQLPPRESVRVEEMVNYFSYSYPEPTKDHPFSITAEVSTCPWNADNRLVHIGLKGKDISYDEQKRSNLVFLIDTSGSMSSDDKLPLLKECFKLLLRGLPADDRIAIVTYSDQARVALGSTPVEHSRKIEFAINRLEASGSTAGAAGIQTAYTLAKQNFIEGGNNRVILATDGDFNVGISSTTQLVEFIKRYRRENVFLTICGFGTGNYKDDKMEKLSNAGNGNYCYIDSMREGKKVFVKQLRSNMFTIAKDVKIKIEFNPTKVRSYRLIGYENRRMTTRDFSNDKKDAGELGAGHSVTALYEVVPERWDEEVAAGSSRYQILRTKLRPEATRTNEICSIDLRYKMPEATKSSLLTTRVLDEGKPLGRTSDNFRFSAAVAGFGMLLNGSPFQTDWNYRHVVSLAAGAKGKDRRGRRTEFLRLANAAMRMSRTQIPVGSW